MILKLKKKINASLTSLLIRKNKLLLLNVKLNKDLNKITKKKYFNKSIKNTAFLQPYFWDYQMKLPMEFLLMPSYSKLMPFNIKDYHYVVFFLFKYGYFKDKTFFNKLIHELFLLNTLKLIFCFLILHIYKVKDIFITKVDKLKL